MGNQRTKEPGASRCLWWLLTLCLLSLLVAVAGFTDTAELGSINITSGGIAWVTTMEGDELEHPSDKITMVEQGEGEAGQEFNSMEEVLQWAIGHSDPEKLKVAAQDTKRMSPQQLEKHRADIKELIDRLRVPSDAELMKIAIADLQNSTLSTEERQRALQELLILVEPIDNANDMADLDKLGGLSLVIAELERAEEELRITAAWVLGKACQNNLIVQKQILQQGGLPRLMEMVGSDSPEEAVKALYALSAVIRNFPQGQEAFFSKGGAALLERLLGGPSLDIRLHRKSLSLVTSLAEESHQQHPVLPDTKDIGKLVTLFSEPLLKAVVNLIESPDLDIQEKALMAVQSLSEVSSRVQRALIDVCKIEDTLERMKLQLQDLLQEADQAEFARDLEVMRQEVANRILTSKEQRHTQDLKDEL